MPALPLPTMATFFLEEPLMEAYIDIVKRLRLGAYAWISQALEDGVCDARRGTTQPQESSGRASFYKRKLTKPVPDAT